MTKKLLILDDEPAIGQLLLDIAESAGVACKYVSAPSAFHQTIKEWDPTHLVIDLRMPEMDGVEVMEQLAHSGCAAEIIILSGVDERVLDAAAQSAADYGLNFVGVLSKPFTPKAVTMLLSDSLGGSVSRNGKKPFVFSPRSRSMSRAELKQALENGYLEAFYQPKIECKSNRLVGFEALSRIRHPEWGLILPDSFIRVAESHNLIYDLTLSILDQALSFLARKFGSNPAGDCAQSFSSSPLRVAVNVSCQILRRKEFVEDLLLRCRKYDVSPERVILELTETAAMENPAESLALLTRLRVQGFHLSIDDFGIGYSSMLQLVKLPFSEIKIDKSFVMTATSKAESRTVISSVVSLGRSLNLCSTAEGIEDAETLDYLRYIGCDTAQGYLISRPVPESQILQWIHTRCSNGVWNAIDPKNLSMRVG